LIQLGRIEVASGSSIRDARRKLMLVSEWLTGDAITATRLAAATSEACRLICREAGKGVVALGVRDSSGEPALVLAFEAPRFVKASDLLDSFFDSVEQRPTQNGLHVIQAVQRLRGASIPTADEIANLRSIVERKGRDALMEELQARNRELQQSLEDLKRTTSVKERMEGELNIGREIQMSMLPLEFPAFPDRSDFTVFAALHPAREVGGDFYDFFLIDEDRFCLCVGDVSGKGVPAALFMAVTKTLIKSRAANDLSPASILSHVNTELSHKNDSSMFVTVFLGILDLRGGEFVYTNAGHNPPYLKKLPGAILRLDARHGPVLGAVEGLAYTEDTISLAAGDLLFLYTDGVTEAMNEEQRLFSDQRLEDWLVSSSATSVEEAVQAGVDVVWDFQGSAEQADDVTVLAVQFFGSEGSSSAPVLEVELVNRIEEIDRLNEAFKAFASQHDISDAVGRKMNVVFDELLNNVISHAFDDDDEHIIEVSVRFTDDRIFVTLTDDGKPFNPFTEELPDTGLSVTERPMGGLGIHLVRSMVDVGRYERHGERNVVHIEMQLGVVL
jgi:sigma-B regulation protein RsbU (phosphoserine phosphatase)